jgi:hypothetical protein
LKKRSVSILKRSSSCSNSFKALCDFYRWSSESRRRITSFRSEFEDLWSFKFESRWDGPR